MSHTREPWKVQDGFFTIYSMSNGSSGLTTAIAATISTQLELPETAKDNANRIVACVNACTGISTEVLEANENKVSILLSQRDELLKFAQSIKDYADKYPHDIGIYDHVKYELSTLETPL